MSPSVILPILNDSKVVGALFCASARMRGWEKLLIQDLVSDTDLVSFTIQGLTLDLFQIR